MSDLLAHCPYPHHQPDCRRPHVFYAVLAPRRKGLALSRSKYRRNGFSDAWDFMACGLDRYWEVLNMFREVIRMKPLPDGVRCTPAGNADEPDSNNVHIEVRCPSA